MKAPSVLSFNANSAETLKFLTEIKDTLVLDQQIKAAGRLRRRPVRLDFDAVVSISIPVAVILSAELHRWSLIRKTQLTLNSSIEKNPRLKALLHDLGSFELLNISTTVKHRDPNEEIVLHRLSSDESVDGVAMKTLQSHIQDMGVQFKTQRPVFDALVEAVSNCIEHAYIKTVDNPKYPYAGHRWWATSCYDPAKDSLRFFVYDQGVGIPASLPMNEDFWSSIGKVIKRLASKTDASLVEAAFEVGRSRTVQGHRGKGLDRMHLAIRTAGAGYLRILSGRGDVTLSYDGKVKKLDHRTHIGGTLAEWSIPLDVLQEHGP